MTANTVFAFPNCYLLLKYVVTFIHDLQIGHFNRMELARDEEEENEVEDNTDENKAVGGDGEMLAEEEDLEEMLLAGLRERHLQKNKKQRDSGDVLDDYLSDMDSEDTEDEDDDDGVGEGGGEAGVDGALAGRGDGMTEEEVLMKIIVDADATRDGKGFRNGQEF